MKEVKNIYGTIKRMLARMPKPVGSIFIRVVEAKNIKAMDKVTGFSDPYVDIGIDKDGWESEFQTHTKYKTLSPVWNEVFMMPIWQEAIDKNNLLIKIKDSDLFKQKDFIGQIVLPIKDLQEKKITEGWFPLLNEKKDGPRPGHMFLKVVLETPFDPDAYDFHVKAEKVKIKYDDIKEVDEKFSVFTGSWNLCSNDLSSDLEAWIPKSGHQIYAIGLQECKSDQSEQIVGALKKHLSDYTLVKTIHCFALRICLFVETKKKGEISQLDFRHVEATGEKGAVAISLNYRDTKLCFIAAHITNKNVYQEIFANLKLDKNPDSSVINQFHHIFLLTSIVSKNDDLKSAIEAFKEGENQAGDPVYRYNVDGINKDARILWKSLQGYDITLTKYASVDDITDRVCKPVFATYDISLLDLPIGMDDDKGAPSLVISKLNASDINKHSNVLVKFFGTFLKSTGETPKVSGVNPSWSADIALHPTINAVKRLEKHFLSVCLYDAHELSKTPIGGCVLSIKEPASKAGTVIPFDLPVYYQGIQKGFLKGEIKFDLGTKLSKAEKARIASEKKANANKEKTKREQA